MIYRKLECGCEAHIYDDGCHPNWNMVFCDVHAGALHDDADVVLCDAESETDYDGQHLSSECNARSMLLALGIGCAFRITAGGVHFDDIVVLPTPSCPFYTKEIAALLKCAFLATQSDFSVYSLCPEQPGSAPPEDKRETPPNS